MAKLNVDKSDAPIGVTSRADCGAYPESDWYAHSFLRKLSCPSCHGRLPASVLPDIPLQELPPRGPLNFVFGLNLGLIRNDLVEELGQGVVESHLRLGRVLAPKTGAPLLEYATFEARCQVMVRGNKESTYRHCETCDTHLYFPFGRLYLMRSHAPQVALAESQIHTLVLSPSLFAQLSPKTVKKLYVTKLAILDKAQDGRDLPF